MSSRNLSWYVLALFIGLSLGATVSLGREYPYLYRSAYFLGRGDTGIAVAEDSDAIFYNPAGLALGQGIYKQIVFAAPMLEISQSTRDVIKQIGLQGGDPIDTLRHQEGQPQHIGLNAFSGIILRRAAIGAFAHNSTTALLYKDHEKGALESFQAESLSDAGLTFSLAHNFGKYFFLGSTLKYFKRNQAYFKANATDSEQIKQIDSSDQLTMLGSGAGADLGLMFQSQGKTRLAFGLTLQDVGNTILKPDKPSQLSKSERPLKDIKQTLNAGIALEPGTKHSRFRLLLDGRDLLSATGQSPYKRAHLGAELTLRNVVGFMAGLNQGYPTFGTYLDLHFFRLDLGMYGEEVGERVGSRPDTRYFIKLHAGL